MTSSNRRTDALVAAADTAGRQWATTAPAERRRVLYAVAEALDADADRLVEIAQRETHLPPARLRSEITRTTFQIRLLADAAAAGEHLDVRVDRADPAWPMGAPRPDLRRTCVPLGPVVVFGASNFPFAFSVAGGDTTSALAAGCSVIVKAHHGHPDLSDATAETVNGALGEAGAPSGLFALIHGEEEARAILEHPDIKAGAFTGSVSGGRALFDLARSRPEPIPFYGELGSVNPVFVTASAAGSRAADIADGFIGSFTLGAGQFCTKPGVIMVPADSPILEVFGEAQLPQGAALLNPGLAEGHRRVREQLARQDHVEILSGGGGPIDAPSPVLLVTDAAAFLENFDALFVECFGPTAVVVTYGDEKELIAVAEALDGQLTATLFAELEDSVVPALTAILARKAGRLLWNQWPTGVSVTYAQQHGGPYPAATVSGSTSVGTAALARFVRPVAWQGFPDELLPEELRDNQSLLASRRVGGLLVTGG